MPGMDVQNYSGGWTGVDVIGAAMEKIQCYNGTGSDLPNGSVVQVVFQADGTSLIGPTVGTPASSSGVHVLIGVVDCTNNPNDGTAFYGGIKSTQVGYVRIYGYCPVVNGTGATTAGHYLIAANGVLTATDSASFADTVFAVVITGHASTAGPTDAFLMGRWITIA
jgi:hypothetical protein